MLERHAYRCCEHCGARADGLGHPAPCQRCTTETGESFAQIEQRLLAAAHAT